MDFDNHHCFEVPSRIRTKIELPPANMILINCLQALTLIIFSPNGELLDAPTIEDCKLSEENSIGASIRPSYR